MRQCFRAGGYPVVEITNNLNDVAHDTWVGHFTMPYVWQANSGKRLKSSCERIILVHEHKITSQRYMCTLVDNMLLVVH